MTDNYKITKQILLETLKVKMEYEEIIQKTLQVDKVGKVMLKIIQ